MLAGIGLDMLWQLALFVVYQQGNTPLSLFYFNIYQIVHMFFGFKSTRSNVSIATSSLCHRFRWAYFSIPSKSQFTIAYSFDCNNFKRFFCRLDINYNLKRLTLFISLFVLFLSIHGDDI